MPESSPEAFISTDQGFVARPWSPLYIGVIAYFCLLVPGVLLMGLNYRRMKLPVKARYSLMIGVPIALVYLALLLKLPESADNVLNIVQVALALLVAGIPYADYRKYHAKHPGLSNASLWKPVLLSIAFPVAVLGGDYLYAEHRDAEKQQLLESALLQYNSENYTDAISTLRIVRSDFPSERLGYINTAIAFEALGQRDSAVAQIRNWLEIAPNDTEAQTILNQLSAGS